jgi:hypothetical protein
MQSTINATIEVDRLVADLRALAAESRALKALLGARWTRSMAEAQKQLVRLRKRTTELCVLRAFSRGRFHARSAPKDGAYHWGTPGVAKWQQHAWHARVAERVAKDYAVAPEARLAQEGGAS